jgi:SH3 domain-containing YSC84-like protein 1
MFFNTFGAQSMRTRRQSSPRIAPRRPPRAMSSKHLQLKREILRAIAMLEDYTTAGSADGDMEIGSEALKNCRGVAFLTSYTVGFFGGGTFTHGVLIAKKPGSEEWSVPVALSGGGATGMFGVGYKEDSQVYVLDTDEAVETCFSQHSVKVGLTASVSLGPLGRSIDGSAFIGMDPKYVNGKEARKAVGVHHYSYSKGVFIGAGIEVSYFSTRDDDTREYYGLNDPAVPDAQLATCRQIIRGEVVIDSSAYAEVEQLLSAVQFASGDERPGAMNTRGTSWSTTM